MPKPRISLRARFWSKVQKTDGCWLWTGTKTSYGYGEVFIEKYRDAQGKRRQRCDKAHRVAWGLTYGLIPDGLEVCHHCDVPLCCRPDHLFLGTQRDNMRDMDVKGRRKTRAKLTRADVLAIRSRYATGGVTQQALADEYGVGRTNIAQIVRRASWRCL